MCVTLLCFVLHYMHTLIHVAPKAVVKKERRKVHTYSLQCTGAHDPALLPFLAINEGKGWRVVYVLLVCIDVSPLHFYITAIFCHFSPLQSQPVLPQVSTYICTYISSLSPIHITWWGKLCYYGSNNPSIPLLAETQEDQDVWSVICCEAPASGETGVFLHCCIQENTQLWK